MTTSADARALTPRSTDAAISLIYELGITFGRVVNGAAVYDPHGTVERGAMAAFITRALAHTKVRPEGLTAQVDKESNEVIVSYRNADYQPPSDEQKFDIFKALSSKKSQAFYDNGTCNPRVVSSVEEVGEPCEIDALDDVTENGDRSVSVTPDATGTVVWVWTGSDGDEISEGAEQEGLIELTLTKAVLSTSANSAKVTSSHKGTVFSELARRLTTEL